jgi:hypothetical protein
MIWLGIIAVLLLVVVITWWLTRPRPRCPECNSYQVGLVSKLPQDIRTIDYPPMDEGGVFTAVQMLYQVTYRCNQCQATWTKTITETR